MGQWSLTDMRCACTLILDIPAFRAGRNRFLLFINHQTMVFLLQQPKQTKSHLAFGNKRCLRFRWWCCFLFCFVFEGGWLMCLLLVTNKFIKICLYHYTGSLPFQGVYFRNFSFPGFKRSHHCQLNRNDAENKMIRIFSIKNFLNMLVTSFIKLLEIYAKQSNIC